jgi:hypothetical protein
MNKLLIYNGNVHEASTVDFKKHVLKVSNSELAKDKFNYDEFCDNELKKILDKEYDIIYITLNLSDIDYLSLEGLRVAHHIRLTQKLYNSKTPIVILCQETIDQILKLSSLGSVLLTPCTFLSSDLTLKEEFPVSKLSDEQYKKYLTRIKIDSPDNYQSHHSTANEWALYRYASAIKKPINEKGIKYYDELHLKLANLTYLKTLHFKYHEALFHRQYFKDREKYKENRYEVSGIEGKKIALIEDEYAKGWIEFYNCISEESKAQLISFTEFDKSLERDKLIENIKTWLKIQIDTSSLCDLYIIDLRLHDEDFYEKDPKKLSGFQISEFLKKVNPGIQILISSASDKFRNFHAFIEKGINNFSIKESPETNFNKQETGSLISDLQILIKEGCSKSYLAKIYSLIQYIEENHRYLVSSDEKEIKFKNKVFGKYGLLMEVFNYLNNPDQITRFNSLMTCFNILEEYISLYSDFPSSQKSDIECWRIVNLENQFKKVYSIKQESKNFFTMKTFTLKKGFFKDLIMEEVDENVNPPYNGIEFHEEKKSSDKRISSNNMMVQASLVLYYRNNISPVDLERLFKLRWIRNNKAHSGNLKQNYILHQDEIEFFIIKIFKVILLNES